MRKALGAPQIAMYAVLVLLRSVSHAIEIARFYRSEGVWGGVIEIRITCHDLQGNII